MKHVLKIISIAILALIINLGSVNQLHANGGAPPPPPPQHGQGGNVPGGGAPVGEGLLILSVLAGAWGVKKMRSAQKKSAD
jgi:hypothetical protein